MSVLESSDVTWPKWLGWGAVIGVAWAADQIYDMWVDDPAATEEHHEYKERASQIPPPDLDECERLKWLLKREQDVVDAMKLWDEKWNPGRHAVAIQQRSTAISKLKQEIREKCEQCPL